MTQTKYEATHCLLGKCSINKQIPIIGLINSPNSDNCVNVIYCESYRFLITCARYWLIKSQCFSFSFLHYYTIFTVMKLYRSTIQSYPEQKYSQKSSKY